MRARLAAFFKDLPDALWKVCRRAIEREGGFTILDDELYHGDLVAMVGFFEQAPIDELLDSITYIYQGILKASGPLSHSSPHGPRLSSKADSWLKFCERTMREENVGFTLDVLGGVHYYVDEEFERSRASVLSCLHAPALASVRQAVEDAFGHLDARPLQGKAAIRSMFEAVESAYRRLVPGERTLNKNGVKTKLASVLMNGESVHPVNRTVTEGMCESLAYWANTLHDYRHGQPDSIPVEPGEAMVVYVLSTGCAHVRFLAKRAAEAPDPPAV